MARSPTSCARRQPRSSSSTRSSNSAGSAQAGKKGPGARLWWLTITDKVKHGSEITLTLQPYQEDDSTGGIPAGNVYVVTQPYRAPPEPTATDPQAVVLGIAEVRGLPPKAHEERGEAIMVSMFALFSRAMKQAHERRALARH